MKKHFNPGDLRAAARLLAQGTQEVTQIVEGVHSAVHKRWAWEALQSRGARVA